jgi:TonB family protein
MRTRSIGAFVTGLTLVLSVAAVAHGAEPDFSSVRELYVSAAYEDALSALNGFDATAAPELVERYRALCLLGLGRTADAERALERLVAQKPLYALPQEEVSPRLLNLFQDVRKRSLPAAARRAFTDAKGHYDQKNYEAARSGFEHVLAILNDRDAVEHAFSLGELKQLADGFLTLSEAAIAPAPAPAPIPEPAPRPAPPRVYTAADEGVDAPISIQRVMPQWTPTNPAIAQRGFRGTLEVVVSEEGTVEWAGMAKPTFAAYDGLVVEAAKQWRFRPATRNGIPVKYRLAVEIVLLPSAREEEGGE